LFTITGHVNRCCACEAPLGITLGELVRTFGGGMRGQSRFKMALTGGAAGMIVPESLLDVPLDFAAEESGVLLGSGAMLILDQSVSAVTLLSWIVRFFEVESCGKCTPCREGTQEVRAMLERIANGRGQAGDLARLQVLADMLASTSLCGLGRSVAWPIRSALAYFAADFAALGAR
jgi:NADH:ubiquinone oxidoreductase subunit F (NADH-binding)